MKQLNSDRYSGIFTVIAILFAVIYASGPYDIWDQIIGILGSILGFKYLQEIVQKSIHDWFFTLLLSILLSTSITAIVMPLCHISKEQDISLFSSFSIIFFFLIMVYQQKEKS